MHSNTKRGLAAFLVVAVTVVGSCSSGIAESDSPDDPFDGGTYELAASTLTLESTFGQGCEIGATGHYMLTAGPGDREISELSVGPEDPCEQRRAELERGLEPAKP